MYVTVSSRSLHGSAVVVHVMGHWQSHLSPSIGICTKDERGSFRIRLSAACKCEVLIHQRWERAFDNNFAPIPSTLGGSWLAGDCGFL